MNQPSSFRAILRSSSIIGGASVISILIGLAKFKLVALILGPSGIGTVGLLLNIVSVGAAIGGLGLATAATRQIAATAATNDEAALADVRRAVVWAALGLAVLTGVAMLVLRDIIAQLTGPNGISSSDMSWLALATAMTIAAGAQTAMLTGMRRIGDLARITIGGAVIGAVAGLAAIAVYGSAGIVAFIVAPPLGTLLLGHLYVTRLPKSPSVPVNAAVLWTQWRMLAWIGFGLMASSLVGSGGQLFVRSYLQAHVGPAELGYFQAAWMISMNYLTFVLTAMATDFYPRLTATIADRDASTRMINEQSEIVLLLVGPLMLGLVALAPLAINLLYSSRFAPAISVLQLQTIGDLLKVLSWPLGIAILAAGRSMTVFFLEALAMAVLGGVTAALLPLVGIKATGYAFIAMYLAYLPAAWWQAKRITGVRLNSAVLVQGGTLLVLLAAIAAISMADRNMGMIVGVPVSLVVGMMSLNRLVRLGDLPAPVLRLRRLLSRRTAQD